jgi:hypothetical protein
LGNLWQPQDVSEKGTVYVYEGGYWQHQVAMAITVLPFDGDGAKTLESHLRLLELTGRPMLAKV